MSVSLANLVKVFGRIGVMSFGGPAGQIALMHKELVDDRPWLTEDHFLRALSFCMLLPGPEAMQLATYVGWKLRGISGGLIAGLLFVAPGATVILCLAMAYLSFGTLPLFQAAFLGIKAAVVMVVIQAILRLSNKALKGTEPLVIAILAFGALFLFSLPFPLVIGLAALWGAWRCTDKATYAGRPDLRASAKLLLFGVLLWFAPLAFAAAIGATFLVDLGLFFSKLAVVTFGGAYAVLAYMTQEVVSGFGWLSTQEMIDALGLAETTPGPLILVTQFVGHLAGAQQGGTGLAVLAGLLTLWMTFVPCFIWIFAGAPLIDWLEGQPRISAALAAITAAVVGVIANLSLWFAVHVVFETVNQTMFGPMSLISPDWSTVNFGALVLCAVAAILLFRVRLNLPLVLGICGLAGLGLGLATGALPAA